MFLGEVLAVNIFKLSYAFWQEGRKTCYKYRRKQDGRAADCQRKIQAVDGVPNGYTALELSEQFLELELYII